MKHLLLARFLWLTRLLHGERGESGQGREFALAEIAWLEAQVGKLRAEAEGAAKGRGG